MSDERTVTPPNGPPVYGGDGEVLDLVAEVARTIFQAGAASVILNDPSTSELVVAAAVGEGAAGIVGRRIPAGVGIAGGVFVDGEPIAVDDVASDARFARLIAEASGYVPIGLMAAPLVHDGQVLGVLEVLDRPQFSRFSLAELDLLALYARLSAAAIAPSLGALT